jgi:small subunit ribosomal protein S2
MSDQNIIDALFKAGSHYGYSKTRRHPSTANFIFGTKNRVDIIDIEHTASQLEKVQNFVKELSSKGKTIVFVGVKPEAKEAVKAGAERIGQLYVVERWVGGVLTNLPEIKKRITKMIDLKAKKESGELEKYTKKERLLIDEEVARMHKLFSGLASMTKKPDAMFVIDPKKEHIAVTEAKKVGIPVIGVANTDTNIKVLDYPIIANDSSLSSIQYIVDSVVDAYKAGVSSAKSE